MAPPGGGGSSAWELYWLAYKLTAGASTLLEWDAKVPEFPVVHAEVGKAINYMSERLSPAPAAAARS